MPSGDDSVYEGTVAVSESGEVYTLLASQDRLVPLTYGADAASYLPEVDHGLQITSLSSHLRDARIFFSGGEPIVVAAQQGATHIWRQN